MLKEIGKSAADWTIKNAPTILTAVGAAGVVLTAVAAGKASIKAKKALEDIPEDADIKEKAKVVAPIMAKPFLLGAATIGCIFYANHEHLKREAALAAVYSISSKALDEYEAKVIDTIGENKNKKIKDAIAEDKVSKNPPPDAVVFSNDEGMTVCYDNYTGRYFKADIETIRKVQNDLNDIMIKDGFVALNEYYERLGLPGIKTGEDIGWNVNYDDLIDFEFSSQLSEQGIPVLVINFRVDPKEYYDSSY